MQKEVSAIVEEVAKNRGLPVEIVEAVFLSQFRQAKISIQEGEAGNPSSFKNVRFIALGVLRTTETKINKLTEQCQKKKS